MKCLCCGKDIKDNAAGQEKQSQWHSSCTRRFFGTPDLPEVDLTEETLSRIAFEAANKGFTVPGVQKKLSLHLSSAGGRTRLTLVDYPTGYILKPQTEDYPSLPEAEYLIMQMAKAAGIATVPFALIRIGGDPGSMAYITKRIDRILPSKKQPEMHMLAMEDFCQLEQRLTENKYRGSYESCARVITRYSVHPGLDLSELFMRIVFSFVIGNSDMHLKNFSLIENEAASQQYVLSEAYDMLPVSVLLPEDTEQMALTVNGKKRNIRRNDFLAFAKTSGIPRDAAVKMMQRMIAMKPVFLKMCAASFLPDPLKEKLSALIEERTAALTPNTPTAS